MKITFGQPLLPYYLAVFIVAFVLYGNSIKNKYALDDELVTLNNQRVEMGIKGIPEILTSFHNIDEKSRYEYRPLVLISFALEYQFLGRNPHFSHFINVFLYALTCMVIFYLLRSLLLSYGENTKYRLVFPLLATLLFTAHPLHTEVVDNLKSRDELLSLLNSLIATMFFARYAGSDKKLFLFWGFLFLFLAILSKKTAVVFLAIIPLVLFFSEKLSWKKVVFPVLFSLAALLSYVVLKKMMISEKPVRSFNYFENPLFSEPGFIKSIPAGLYTIWNYVELLIFPHPLSFYYGYDQVPIPGWNNIKVWISLVFHVGIFLLAIRLLRKKHILSFAILFYLFALFPFSNFIFPVVGIIGERFAYIASLGFCIILAFLICKLFRIPVPGGKLMAVTGKPLLQRHNRLPLLIFFSAFILLLYSFKTITRNSDWKDHLTLYRHDIKHVDRSAKAHALISNTIYPELFKMPAGIQKDNLVEECIHHYKKSLEIYPDYIVSNNNLGSIYFTFRGDYRSALFYFKKAVLLDSNYLEAYYNLAYSYEKLGWADSAVFFFEKALIVKPSYKPAYDRLFPLYFSSGEYDRAIDLNLRAASNMPGLSALYFVNTGNVFSAKKDTLQALNYFIKAFEQEPANKDLCLHIAKIYEKIRNDEKAGEYFRKAEELSLIK